MQTSLLHGCVLRTLLPGFCLVGCVGTTGGDTFEFSAAAAGPSVADGSTYTFAVAATGYEVTLTRAILHIGALYLNRGVPTSVSGNTSCTLPGIYGAEITPAHGFDVNAISPERQPFPVLGHATSDPDFTGEVWLNGGDVDAPDDTTVIFDVAGTAVKADTEYPFTGQLTIGRNHLTAGSPALPSLHPICKERIVTPIAVTITPESTGLLQLQIDPARMFTNVDFADLALQADGLYHFDDEAETSTHPVDHASKSLYAGLHATTAYRFSWLRP